MLSLEAFKGAELQAAVAMIEGGHNAASIRSFIDKKIFNKGITEREPNHNFKTKECPDCRTLMSFSKFYPAMTCKKCLKSVVIT